MPTLSFLLAAVLVSSGAMYSYLSSTKKIEESKAKIAESDKIVYISKRASLNLSVVKNSDTNQSDSIMSLGSTKLSNFVAKDDTTSKAETLLLDKLQKAMMKVVVDSGEDNPSCQTLADTNLITKSECLSIKDKQFTFYGVKSSGIDIPKNSMIAKASLLNSRLQDKIKSTQTDDKIAKKKIAGHKRKLEDTARLVKAISVSKDSAYLAQVGTKYLNTTVKTTSSTKIKDALNKNTIIKDDTNIAEMMNKYEEKEDSSTVQIAKEREQLDEELKTLLAKKEAIEDNNESVNYNISKELSDIKNAITEKQNKLSSLGVQND